MKTNKWHLDGQPHAGSTLIDPNGNKLFAIAGNYTKVNQFIDMLNHLNRGMAKTKDGVFIIPMYTDLWVASKGNSVGGPYKAYMDLYGIVIFFGPEERNRRPLKMYDETEELFSSKEEADKYKSSLYADE